MTAAIRITCNGLDAAGLHRTGSIAPSRRMVAVALVLEGTFRIEAAQAAGMDRQTLRDRVHLYNEASLAGLT